jgi:hypothetical protein
MSLRTHPVAHLNLTHIQRISRARESGPAHKNLSFKPAFAQVETEIASV